MNDIQKNFKEQMKDIETFANIERKKNHGRFSNEVYDKMFFGKNYKYNDHKETLLSKIMKFFK